MKDFALTLVRAYPIGVISMLDNGKNDEKIIAVPFNDPNYNIYHDISELPPHLVTTGQSSQTMPPLFMHCLLTY